MNNFLFARAFVYKKQYIFAKIVLVATKECILAKLKKYPFKSKKE
jgi:hypothetical protein